MKPPQGSSSTSAVTNLLFPPGGKVVYIMNFISPFEFITLVLNFPPRRLLANYHYLRSSDQVGVRNLSYTKAPQNTWVSPTR